MTRDAATQLFKIENQTSKQRSSFDVFTKGNLEKQNGRMQKISKLARSTLGRRQLDKRVFENLNQNNVRYLSHEFAQNYEYCGIANHIQKPYNNWSMNNRQQKFVEGVGLGELIPDLNASLTYSSVQSKQLLKKQNNGKTSSAFAFGSFMSKGIPHALATGGPDPYNESFGRVFKQDREQAKIYV